MAEAVAVAVAALEALNSRLLREPMATAERNTSLACAGAGAGAGDGDGDVAVAVACAGACAGADGGDVAVDAPYAEAGVGTGARGQVAAEATAALGESCACACACACDRFIALLAPLPPLRRLRADNKSPASMGVSVVETGTSIFSPPAPAPAPAPVPVPDDQPAPPEAEAEKEAEAEAEAEESLVRSDAEVGGEVKALTAASFCTVLLRVSGDKAGAPALEPEAEAEAEPEPEADRALPALERPAAPALTPAGGGGVPTAALVALPLLLFLSSTPLPSLERTWTWTWTPSVSPPPSASLIALVKSAAASFLLCVIPSATIECTNHAFSSFRILVSRARCEGDSFAFVTARGSAPCWRR